MVPISLSFMTVDFKGVVITVWKFQDIFVTKILREINFGESRSSKTTIFFSLLEVLNFVVFVNFGLQKLQNLEPLNVLKWLSLHF